MENNLKGNTFVEVILVQRFNKVNYYSVSINKQASLFEQFVTKHTLENKEKLNHIMEWIKIIGNKIGAKEHYFRNESETANTRALPPKGKERNPTYVEVDNRTCIKQNVPNNLRLYCMRLSEEVVFLFNGAVKTSHKAQDCEQVRTHFRLANQLTKQIEKAIIDKEIKWNDDYTDIIIEQDFYFLL